MKRIGIYLRVSTQDQSTELQLKEIQAYLVARGWTDARIYEDKATGTNANRPMLKALLYDARERKLDTVVCWKLDRFARSLKDLVTMLQELNELGIEFISLKDQLDFSTSTGKLMANIIGAFAQFEADIIKERVRAGIANAKAKGRRLGRPTRISREQVLEMRSRGRSLNQIAKQLGCTKGGVSKILSKAGSQVAENTSQKNKVRGVN
jgi:DNA invertase Pin-like site-specific DNA recombinase